MVSASFGFPHYQIYPGATALPDLPLDRLHLETDAPYLGPKNAKKRRPYNEPANLIWVARAVAELKGISEEVVAEACTENSRRLFGLSLSSPVAQS